MVRAAAAPPSQAEGQGSCGGGTLGGYHPVGRGGSYSAPCCPPQTQCTRLQLSQLQTQIPISLRWNCRNLNLLWKWWYSPMWVKRGALLTIWTCVAFTGRERKVVYSGTERGGTKLSCFWSWSFKYLSLKKIWKLQFKRVPVVKFCTNYQVLALY